MSWKILALFGISLLAGCASHPVAPTAGVPAATPKENRAVYGTWKRDTIEILSGTSVDMELVIGPEFVTVSNTCSLPDGQKMTAIVSAPADVSESVIHVREAKVNDLTQETKSPKNAVPKKKNGKRKSEAAEVTFEVKKLCSATVLNTEWKYKVDGSKLTLEDPIAKQVQTFTQLTGR